MWGKISVILETKSEWRTGAGDGGQVSIQGCMPKHDHLSLNLSSLPSFLLSFLPLPTTLITSGLKRTAVKCWNSLDRKVSSRPGEGRTVFYVLLPALCFNPQMPPSFFSCSALTLHHRLQRGSHRPGRYISASPGDGLHKCSLLYKGASCLEASCPRPLFCVLWHFGSALFLTSSHPSIDFPREI